MYVAAMIVIAVFAILIGTYTAVKAFKISETFGRATADGVYELEKDYSLVSTVGWVTLISRLVAAPLFFVTVISLISSVPGAMCEFGVFQAGSPYSWMGFGIKFVTIFAFGGWLFLERINAKAKNPKIIGSLSKLFVLLTPLLYVDAALDLMFFGSLEPLVVPCCMVVYTPGSFIQCPFCLVTFEMPLLLIAIPAFIVSVALMTWVSLSRGYIKNLGIEAESKGTLSGAIMVSIVLIIIGLLAIAAQLVLGLSF